MFVSHESLGEIQNKFFYDKSFLMGSNSERIVSQFLELSCNPKGKLAYKYIFDMHEENQFVTADAVCVTVTPTQKQFIEHLLQNAEHYSEYLIDALERATHFCELDLTKQQLRQDYILRELSTNLKNATA